MPADWTITAPGGAVVPLHQLNLKVVGGQFVNQGIDTCTLELTEAFDENTGLYDYKDAVSLYRDGVQFFRGNVIRTPRMGRTGEELIRFELGGPWWWLENIIYEQEWALGSGSIFDSRVVLQQDPAGPFRSTIEEIEAVIDYAITQSAPIAKGTFAAGLDTFPTEARNITCAEAILRMLRWHPQYVAWFDYSTSTPTLNIQARSALDSNAVLLDGTGGVSEFNIRSRDDLKPEAVRIVYETSNNFDGEVFRAISEDKWPAAHSGQGFGVLNGFVELEGQQQQTNKQRIKTRTIPAAATAAAQDFAISHEPALENFNPARWSVITLDRRFETPNEDDPDPDPVNPNAEKVGSTTVADVPRELIEGQIEDWMRVRVEPVVCKLLIRYTANLSTDPPTVEELKWFGVDLEREIEFVIRATDATTKLYKGRAFWVPPEVAPANVAQTIYEQLEDLQWQGAFTLVGQDPSADRWHGKTVNFTGSDHPDWATCKALVQSVAWDLATGTVTPVFGPAEHLGPQDMIELMRSLRKNREHWWSTEERSSNTASADQNQGAAGDTVGAYNHPVGRGGSVTGKAHRPPIVPIVPQFVQMTSATSALVTFSPAILAELHCDLAHHQIEAPLGSGDFLDDSPRPQLSFSGSGDHEVWISCRTNENGKIVTTSQEVGLSVGEPAGTYQHHGPGTGEDSGQEGYYKWHVGTLNISGGTWDWIPAAPVPLFHHFVPRITHLGGTGIIAKQFDASAGNCQWLFRGLEREGSQIQCFNRATNIAFRGNEKVGTLRYITCEGSHVEVLHWDDGLITDESTIDIPVGDCSSTGTT